MTTPLITQLCRHEGFKSMPYLCTAGKETCGFGYNMEANPLLLTRYELTGFRVNGITRPRALDLLTRQLDEIRGQLEKRLPWWNTLSPARQDVLSNMAMNMGLSGLLKFKATLALLERGDYAKAAKEMLDSLWAKQVKGRAVELAEQMKTGEYA